MYNSNTCDPFKYVQTHSVSIQYKHEDTTNV